MKDRGGEEVRSTVIVALPKAGIFPVRAAKETVDCGAGEESRALGAITVQTLILGQQSCGCRASEDAAPAVVELLGVEADS